MLAQMSWKEVWRMIKEEKKNGNSLAELIHSLDFEKTAKGAKGSEGVVN